MKSWRTIVLILGLVLAVTTACSRMQSAHYPGTKEPLFEELLALDDARQVSVWKYDDDLFYVKPVDKSSAIAATLQWDASQETFQVVSRQLLITRIDDHLFLNIKEDGLYTILRMAFAHTSDNDPIVLFTVKEAKLKADMAAGKIKTKPSTDKDTYVLDVSKKTLDTYIRRQGDDLFDFDSAGTIRLLVEPQEPPDQGDAASESGSKPAEKESALPFPPTR